MKIKRIILFVRSVSFFIGGILNSRELFRPITIWRTVLYADQSVAGSIWNPISKRNLPSSFWTYMKNKSQLIYYYILLFNVIVHLKHPFWYIIETISIPFTWYVIAISPQYYRSIASLGVIFDSPENMSRHGVVDHKTCTNTKNIKNGIACICNNEQ